MNPALVPALVMLGVQCLLCHVQYVALHDALADQSTIRLLATDATYSFSLEHVCPKTVTHFFTCGILNAPECKYARMVGKDAHSAHSVFAQCNLPYEDRLCATRKLCECARPHRGEGEAHQQMLNHQLTVVTSY